MKKISGILKLTLTVCLTVGTTLAMIACGVNNSQGSSSGIGTASTSSPLETQTLAPSQTTSPAAQTVTTTATTTALPVIDEKQKTINKFLTLLDEMAERNGVDEIRDIMLFQKKPELATSDYFQLSFGAVDNMTYNDILEYYILSENEYKEILSSVGYIYEPYYTDHFTKEKLIKRDSGSCLDIINNSIETKERYNKDNPYKYEIDYEKKKEKDLAEFNEFLDKVSAEHSGKKVSSISFERRNGFENMVLYYKIADYAEMNLRSYALKDDWYETIVEKLFGEEQYKTITVDELVKKYDSDVFDCILESIHTYKPVINPKTL